VILLTVGSLGVVVRGCSADLKARPNRRQSFGKGAMRVSRGGLRPTPDVDGARLHDPRQTMSRPRILLVEDEESISVPFRDALVREGFDPLVAATGAEALALARETTPDLVLLDLGLPDADGRDVCRALRRESSVPIVMVTARGTETDRIVGLELGADDYVVKPFSAAEVAARIRAVLRRGAARSEAGRVSANGLEIDTRARRVFVDRDEVELTRKEFDLLARLARDAGNVVTREDLMADVWDVNWFGSTKTLDVHVAWLRGKLGDDPADPRFIKTVRGVGFRLAGPEE
jgi:two-component system response regulator RegX3